jgi:hypothetical protein
MLTRLRLSGDRRRGGDADARAAVITDNGDNDRSAAGPR